jgi:hypothetical protein
VHGATAREAVEEFLRPLRRVVSCVTPGILNIRGGYHLSARPHSVLIGDGLPVRLAGTGRLMFRMVHHYRVAEASGERSPWKVRTAAYYYSLDDFNEREVISYHWHPEGQSPIRFPHLHVGPGAGCQREEIGTAHCPTGRISVAEFLRFAIVDFRVEPLRDDWSDVFAET